MNAAERWGCQPPSAASPSIRLEQPDTDWPFALMSRAPTSILSSRERASRCTASAPLANTLLDSLPEKGTILVAASDASGTLVDDLGLDVAALIAFKGQGHSLRDYPRGRKLDRDAILDVDCDIWIPAARPDVLNADNVARLKAKPVPQGANIPCTLDAELALHKRGILTVPDFIANAGGVICAAIEYRGGTERAAFEYIEERIRANTRVVIEESRKRGDIPRRSAFALAEGRVRAAMQTRRWH